MAQAWKWHMSLSLTFHWLELWWPCLTAVDAEKRAELLAQGRQGQTGCPVFTIGFNNCMLMTAKGDSRG